MLYELNRCKIFDNFCLLCTQRLEFVWVCLDSICHKPVTFVKCDTNFSCHTCHNMLDESNRCKIFYHLCLLCTQKLEFVWVCLDSICHKPVILVNFDTKTCLSLPEFAWVCLGLLEFARVCSGLLGFAWVCLSLLGFACVCLSLLEFAFSLVPFL